MKTKSKREPVTLGMDVAVGDDYRHPPHTGLPLNSAVHLKIALLFTCRCNALTIP